MNTSLSDLKKHCSKPGHANGQILMICLNQGCKQNLLCCCSCVDEQHHKHELISLRKFEILMKSKLQQNNKNVQKGKIVKIFSDFASEFYQSFKALENTLLSQIQSLEHEMQRVFLQVHQTLTIPSHTQLIQILKESQQSKDWSNVLQDIRLCQKHKIGTPKQTNLILDYEFNTFHQKLVKIKKEFKQSIESLKEQIKGFKVRAQKCNQPQQFHQTYKYYEMTRLDNPAVIQKQKNNGIYGKYSGNRTIALGNRPLDPINNSVKFCIIKNGDGIPSICIGAAVLSIVKQSNFTNCLGYKRGVYGIDQAMTSSWGSLQQSNQAIESNQDVQTINNGIGFQFTQGDIIEMTLDFQSETLIFEKDEEIFDMTIDCSYRDLYPFVCLSNSNSVVEILQ